jgi:hypothetical protein
MNGADLRRNLQSYTAQFRGCDPFLVCPEQGIWKRLGRTQGKVLLASMILPIYFIFFSIKKRKPIEQIYLPTFFTQRMRCWGP